MSGERILTLAIVLVVILVSMVLHELAHGLVAYWLGDDTAKDDGRLTLNPIKHLDPVMSFIIPLFMVISGGPVFGGAKPVPVNSSKLKYGPWGMALVAISGPLVNFILALVFFLIGSWTGLIGVVSGALYYSGDFWGLVLAQIVLVNLGFGIFNLIPIPPLDGSRVLYAVAPDPVRDFMERIEHFGIIIIIAILIIAPSILYAILGGATSGVLTGFSWLAGVF